MGSIRATVLDSATAPVIGYDDYDPWGYPLALRTKPIPNAYLQGASKNRFVSNFWDDDYGLNWYHLGSRPYDPQIGRFFIIDPLWAKHPNVTPYNYVLNNPLTFIDPDGKQRYYVHTLNKPPSWAEIKQNFAQRVERSKEYASAGVYTMAVGNLILAPIVAFAQMDAGISGVANPLVIGSLTTKGGAEGLKIVLTKSGEIDKRTKLAKELAKKLENLTTETKDVTAEFSKLKEAEEFREKLAGSQEAEDLASAIETALKNQNVKQETKSFFKKIFDFFKKNDEAAKSIEESSN